MKDIHSSAKDMLKARSAKGEEKDVNPESVIDELNESPKTKAPKPKAGPAQKAMKQPDPDKAVMSEVKKTLGMKQPGRPKGKAPVGAAKKAANK